MASDIDALKEQLSRDLNELVIRFINLKVPVQDVAEMVAYTLGGIMANGDKSIPHRESVQKMIDVMQQGNVAVYTRLTLDATKEKYGR